MTYFGVTTLATVGFGDFYPRTDIERIFCTVLMVIGVAVFSSIFRQVDKAMTKIR